MASRLWGLLVTCSEKRPGFPPPFPTSSSSSSSSSCNTTAGSWSEKAPPSGSCRLPPKQHEHDEWHQARFLSKSHYQPSPVVAQVPERGERHGVRHCTDCVWLSTDCSSSLVWTAFQVFFTPAIWRQPQVNLKLGAASEPFTLYVKKTAGLTVLWNSIIVI